MKAFLVLTLLIGAATAGTLKRPLVPLMPRAELDGRITNGELAKPGQFPYQAGLSLIFGDLGAWCGGSILSDRWILSAAHCTEMADGVTVYLGAMDIDNKREKGQQRIYVSKSGIHTHKDWDAETFANDISMIKMPIQIEWNPSVQPATLPKKNGQYSTYVGDMVWASGWGKDSDAASSVTNLLRYIEVPVIKESTCNQYYLGMITDKMICISGKGGKSTCNGDSGGPLVYKDGDVNYVIGATSFGIVLGCELGWPGVFTRVTAHLDWIEKMSGLVNK